MVFKAEKGQNEEVKQSRNKGWLQPFLLEMVSAQQKQYVLIKNSHSLWWFPAGPCHEVAVAHSLNYTFLIGVISTGNTPSSEARGISE